MWNLAVSSVMHIHERLHIRRFNQAEGSFPLIIEPIGQASASELVLNFQIFLVKLRNVLRCDSFRNIVAVHIDWHTKSFKIRRISTSWAYGHLIESVNLK
jgi:hypothetical protein